MNRVIFGRLIIVAVFVLLIYSGAVVDAEFRYQVIGFFVVAISLVMIFALAYGCVKLSDVIYRILFGTSFLDTGER